MKYLASIFFTAIFAVIANAQFPSIEVIDFYGLRTITESQVREKLQVKEGDAMPNSRTQVQEIEKRIATIPNVVEASINPGCCTNNGKSLLYVGIREKGDNNSAKFHPAPKGTIRLPDEIVRKGDAVEDRSAGHSLMNNPEARAFQEKFIPIANQKLNMLQRVIRESADAKHRALAAEIIAYYKDKNAIVPDLVEAVKDENSTVRNNATRALGLIAHYGFEHPEKRIKVPFEPFIDMLNSLEWTDRNKSSLVLNELTEKRNPLLLDLLRKKAVQSLIEMALWKNDGHASSPFIILGRVAGLSEDEIGQALITAKRKELVARAQKILLSSK